MHRGVRGFSTGMRQRTRLATAIAHDHGAHGLDCPKPAGVIAAVMHLPYSIMIGVICLVIASASLGSTLPASVPIVSANLRVH